jgi:hypothetical protein
MSDLNLDLCYRTFDDLSVFRATFAYEKARPWRETRPTI